MSQKAHNISFSAKIGILFDINKKLDYNVCVLMFNLIDMQVLCYFFVVGVVNINIRCL